MKFKQDSLVKNIILELVNEKYKIDPNKIHKGRPLKCSYNTYIEHIFYVLRNNVGWEHINDPNITGSSIRKTFHRWSKDGIFKDAYEILIYIYDQFKMNLDDLFIDSSHIKNILGQDVKGKNHYDRNRFGTKISIITDNLGTPVSITFSESNIHDINSVESSINNIPKNLEKSSNIIGDKGYISDNLKKQSKINTT